MPRPILRCSSGISSILGGRQKKEKDVWQPSISSISSTSTDEALSRAIDGYVEVITRDGKIVAERLPTLSRHAGSALAASAPRPIFSHILMLCFSR